MTKSWKWKGDEKKVWIQRVCVEVNWVCRCETDCEWFKSSDEPFSIWWMFQQRRILTISHGHHRVRPPSMKHSASGWEMRAIGCHHCAALQWGLWEDRFPAAVSLKTFNFCDNVLKFYVMHQVSKRIIDIRRYLREWPHSLSNHRAAASGNIWNGIERASTESSSHAAGIPQSEIEPVQRQIAKRSNC
jgi:hypothetical protein